MLRCDRTNSRGELLTAGVSNKQCLLQEKVHNTVGTQGTTLSTLNQHAPFARHFASCCSLCGDRHGLEGSNVRYAAAGCQSAVGGQCLVRCHSAVRMLCIILGVVFFLLTEPDQLYVSLFSSLLRRFSCNAHRLACLHDLQIAITLGFHCGLHTC